MGTTQHTTPRTIPVVWARLSLLSAVAFVVFGLGAHVAQPGVDPSWQPPSELALGPQGWLMTGAFVMLGVAGVALFCALRGQAVTRPGKVGRVLVLVGASAGFVAAIFPTDPWTTAPDAMTLTGTLHAIAPVLADAFPVASVLLAISLTRHSPGWRRYRAALVAASAVLVGAVVVLTVSMAMLMPATGMLGPDVLVGWQARVLLLSEALWIGAVAVCAIGVHRSVGAIDGRSEMRLTGAVTS